MSEETEDESATELFTELIESLISGEPVSFSFDQPPWFEEGMVYQISESVYQSHLEGDWRQWKNGTSFTTAHQSAPFTLFWIDEQNYFARKLSVAETTRFRLLANLSFYE